MAQHTSFFRAIGITRQWLLLGLLGTLSACGPERSDAPPSGRSVFNEPLPNGNTFACSTCHALSEPADDGFRRPGHPFTGVLNRSNYKNGRLETFLEAANSCRDDWMGLQEPWGLDNAAYLALKAYLDLETSISGPEISFTIKDISDINLTATGNPDTGQTLFNQTCAICHARDAVGSDRALALIGSRLSLQEITERVRTSGPQQSTSYAGLTGGRMPFWSAERLTDKELADIAAFVLANDPTPAASTTETPTQTRRRRCAPSHERVGKTAVLSGRRRINGTATIVDDCTIRIDNFDFDGGGIDVRIYGGLNGNYDDGFAMGENLVRSTGYFGETLTVQLPPGRTLDEVDGISVWCIPIEVSFGEGTFE